MLLLFDCCLLFGARQWGDLVQDRIIKGDSQRRGKIHSMRKSLLKNEIIKKNNKV